MRRIRSTRNPKGTNYTPEQEAELDRTERAMTRARILEYGVAELLNGEYNCSGNIAEASRVLAEAVTIREEAERVRAEIRRIERAEDPVPANPTRARRTRKKAVK